MGEAPSTMEIMGEESAPRSPEGEEEQTGEREPQTTSMSGTAEGEEEEKEESPGI